MVLLFYSDDLRLQIHVLHRLGVNTGFGGNADTRTQAVEELQHGLMRGLRYRILSTSHPMDRNTGVSSDHVKDAMTLFVDTVMPLDDREAATSMPEAWVRAAMLIRLNSLSRGASGVKLVTVQTLAKLVEMDIIPKVPLRGSISASGDLSPPSYVG